MTSFKLEVINIKAMVTYIDEYKRLSLVVTDQKDIDTVLQTVENVKPQDSMKSPCWLNTETGTLKLRCNLQKYERPNIAKYEKLLKQEITCVIGVREYKTEKYGNGVSCTLMRYQM